MVANATDYCFTKSDHLRGLETLVAHPAPDKDLASKPAGPPPDGLPNADLGGGSAGGIGEGPSRTRFGELNMRKPMGTDPEDDDVWVISLQPPLDKVRELWSGPHGTAGRLDRLSRGGLQGACGQVRRARLFRNRSVDIPAVAEPEDAHRQIVSECALVDGFGARLAED